MMGPAEIVISLKELCEEQGPRLTTEQIVEWIETHGGFESNAELIRFAKKMKARQYARMLEYDDAQFSARIKRLWSVRDSKRSRRYYMDILQMAPERRERMIREYIKFTGQIKSVRRALADSIAGQEFFEFYGEDEHEASETPAASEV